MYSEPKTWHSLMEKLVEAFAVYLVAQVQAGVQAVQLFDSWVGTLNPQDYARFVSLIPGEFCKPLRRQACQ
jgi:uroporphyrinogen decarboxylase